MNWLTATNSIKLFIINFPTIHHRIMAGFLRKRGWVVFYLEERARFCKDNFCWLKLYNQLEKFEEDKKPFKNWGKRNEGKVF